MKNLQEDIKTGNFRRVYLLCGDEAYLKIQYKDKLIKALNPDDDTMNFSKYEGKGIEVREMIDLCETMPFFADYRVILVENSGFFKNKCDELKTEHIVPVLIRKRGWGAVTAILAVMLAILLYRPLFVEETEWREFSVRNIYRVGQNLQDIVSGDRVTQTFVASSAFDHILVQGYLKNGAVPDGGCQMLIQDEEGKKLAEAFLSAQQIAETQLDFTFDPIVPDGETVYTIVIEPKGIRENHALQLYRFNSSMDLYPAGKLSCNGREENGNLIFSVYEERTGTIFRRIFL